MFVTLEALVHLGYGGPASLIEKKWRETSSCWWLRNQRRLPSMFSTASLESGSRACGKRIRSEPWLAVIRRKRFRVCLAELEGRRASGGLVGQAEGEEGLTLQRRGLIQGPNRPSIRHFLDFPQRSFDDIRPFGPTVKADPAEGMQESNRNGKIPLFRAETYGAIPTSA
jgi:hypothetical protein